jgi:hypothetical protein
MSKRLLDQQISLIDHLATGAVIFGDKVDTPEALAGIDARLLHLEARFCHDKRVGKIAEILPISLELLGGHRSAILREFVEMCPPVHIGRLENARQFRDFLRDRRRRTRREQPYVGDVAACELACAEVRNGAEDHRPEVADDIQTWTAIRRSPVTVLLRCAYDVRWFFEDGRLEGDLTTAAPRRETLLIVARSPNKGQPQIFELTAPVFDLAAALDDWIDPAALCLTDEAQALVAHLSRCGLIEVRR